MNIEDVEENWKGKVKEFNNAIAEKIKETGAVKNNYYFEFAEFNI